ncbi:arabinan endo-1,5-alpha-L-arabinosidase [Aridibaculum aurantiacum]|uniref:arabinan endo-1,5-alpha-L-arabinosidase n=1 Tax=Aridibaculum aurantiacum TaxID=2810307 RepID=UPI001A96B79F|nr:arabinan endo-1,5-alpha-L-arabinosidase [Aridibaculum aurantiacum]
MANNQVSTIASFFVLPFFLLGSVSCKKEAASSGQEPTVPITTPFDLNSIKDNYEDVAPFSSYLRWGSHNVHDPSIQKFGDYYYCYSTDAAYGVDVRPGLQIRRSKDLVDWKYIGWVFNGLPAQGAQFIQSKGGTPFNSLWAPYALKVGNEYRLYYSLSSPTPRLSVIGLATSANPEGPWTEKGLVVTSTDDNSRQTNAIDPAVITTAAGEQFMYYGSAWDGIYVLKLNPATGLALSPGDKGTRVANRGFTNGRYNGNIEGPEVIYNPTLNKYYMFIAYDWLETKYNTRVCRADNPMGPFYDFNGIDANTNIDHGPMIIAPYQFMGHGGYQGVSHNAVFTDGSNNYFYASQARPTVNRFFMNLHVRKIFWTQDGWPVVSPQRYAWEDNSTVAADSLAGNWEQIIFGYRVVPGYANEQTSPDLQSAVSLTIAANGTLNGDANSRWTYNAPWLELKWSNGFTDKVFVQKGRDWENKKPTIIFSGLNNQGTAIWGKKK